MIFLAFSLRIQKKQLTLQSIGPPTLPSHWNSAPGEVFEFIYGYEVRKEADRHI